MRLEPDEPVGKAAGASARRLRHLWEKPSKGKARACLARGYLWNTFVLNGGISRTGVPLDPLGPKPDLVVKSFDELQAALA